jgi:hypothetical protein
MKMDLHTLADMEESIFEAGGRSDRTIWQNGNLAKWETGEVGKWQNGKMEKWEMARWEMAKWEKKNQK